MSSAAYGAIAERYSAALFGLAEESASLDAVAADLTALKGLVAESADLRRLIAGPVVSRAGQGAAVAGLAERAGFADLTRKLLGLLAANRRLGSVVAVADAYLARVAAERGETTAHIVSATKLNAARTKSLAQALKKVAGRDVTLDVSVDPSLLGGMVVIWARAASILR